MKIVINVSHSCYFSLNHEATMYYAKLKGIKLYPWICNTIKKEFGKAATLDNPKMEYQFHYATKPIKDGTCCENLKDDNIQWSYQNIKRDDPILVQTVEELGEKVNGPGANLKIVEIPDGTDWQIESQNDFEWVAEKHKKWF